MATLHIHLDESGNLDFSPSGTKYYIFAATWTFYPRALASLITRFRFALLKAGENIPQFHATDDRPAIRAQFLHQIAATQKWNYAGVIIEKAKVDPVFYPQHRFYATFAPMPMRLAFSKMRRTRRITQVLAYTDRIPVARHREYVEKAIKIALQAEIPSAPFHIYHHPSASNTWLQVTDYCCWGLFRSWERGDKATYLHLLPRLVKQEAEVLAQETKRYY